MSDQYMPGTEESSGNEQPAQPEASPPEYLTKTEADQLVKKAVDDALGRQASLYGQGTEKLRTRLEELERQIPYMRDAGINVDNTALQAMRNKIITESLTERVSATPQTSQVAAQQPEAQGIDPNRVNGMAQTILSNMGVTFEQGAPELKMIKIDGTPWEYLETLTNAATAYKKRTSSEDKANPEARIPGLVGGQGKAKEDWQAEYRKEIAEAQKDPINGVEKSLQVRRKYRQLGYSV